MIQYTGGNSNKIGQDEPVSYYGTLTDNAWVEITVPLDDFPSEAYDGFWIIGQTSGTQNTVYVDQVTVVVNYDLPIDMNTKNIDKETYLHRIGRTGRFGKEGLAINFVDSQRTLRMINDLEVHFGRKITKLDATDIEEIEKINQE